MRFSIVAILIIWLCSSCEKPYELVSEEKHYDGAPFVSLSSEQALIRLGINEGVNNTPEAGLFRDSIILSHKLDYPITVFLDVVTTETHGNLNTHFSFQQEVTINSGDNYGSFTVLAGEIPQNEISKYKLTIHISKCDNPDIIAGMYGIKKENEDRQKRFKSYSFQK